VQSGKNAALASMIVFLHLFIHRSSFITSMTADEQHKNENEKKH